MMALEGNYPIELTCVGTVAYDIEVTTSHQVACLLNDLDKI